jgi:hypothetical protein
VLSRPFYFALYLLGAEIFAVKLGPDGPATAPTQLDGGGGTGSHEFGFHYFPDMVTAKDEP